MANLTACDDSQLYNVPLGMACSIGSDVCFSFSFVVQKLAHNRNQLHAHYWELPYWWLGIILLIAGEVGEFLAYGVDPASLISPLGIAAGDAAMLCSASNPDVR